MTGRESKKPEPVPGDNTPARGFHALAPLTWQLLVALVMLLAVYLAGGRLLMSQVPAMRAQILDAVNARVPFDLSVKQLSGGWSGFSPELYFDDLSLSQPNSPLAPLALGRGSLRMDVLASLRSRTLQLSRLELVGLSVDTRLTEQGTLEFPGLAGNGSVALRGWLEGFLPNVQRVALTDQRMRLSMADTVTDLSLNLYLLREGNLRRLQGRIQGSEISVTLNAEGVGNPLRPKSWGGDVFIDAQTTNLESLRGLWETLDWPFRLGGAAAGEFWLTREDGDSSARLRWNSTGLEVEERDGLWFLPIDALSFEAALDHRPRHWSLLTEDFHIERSGQVLDLSRAQFDWQGQALRIRASDLGLDALPALLAAAPGVPQGLRDALPDLAPRGSLSAIEFRLDDLARPAQSWQLRSVVDNLALGSWRRSPSLTGVSGYLELQPGSGSLLLDAKALSVHFPSVYREAQFYDDAVGSIDLAWDRMGLRIQSDLLRLDGDDGLAKALVAVDIPFYERATGVELDLLVGLSESRLAYRDRYLPEKLPSSLKDWLATSIGGGALAQAGFIWRGSVTPKNSRHMTVQLFLDAQDATLTFDPAWPTLQDLDVSVWVNDRQSWARASRGSMLDLSLDRLTVGVLAEQGGADLRISTAYRGEASAASHLLTATPLADLTSNTFSGWPFSGSLEGDLDLALHLGADPKPPQVRLETRFSDLASEVLPLALPATDISGELRYSSSDGLRGSKLSGSTLGGDFTLTAVQLPNELQLELHGDVRAEFLQDWLNLPLLGFASGKADFDGLLRVPGPVAGENPGSVAVVPTLQLHSDLADVRLDAPAPFNKGADQRLSMKLSLPVQSNPLVTLTLGERLRMDLQLEESELTKLIAFVGSDYQPTMPCSSKFCVRGNVSSLDLADWASFYRRYIATTAAAPLVDADGALGSLQSYEIDSLSVGELSLGALHLGEARVDLWGKGSLWQGALESEPLQGSLTREDGDLRLLIEYLNVDHFAASEADDGEPLRLSSVQQFLPSMRVDLLDLRRGEQSIGFLGFDIDTQHSDDAVYAREIEGDLWGMSLAVPEEGMLQWRRTADGESTHLELDMAFEDLGEVLAAAGYVPTIESEKGRASLRLNWPGSPSAFLTARSEGEVRLSARNGRILEDRPGALAMVSLLNFAGIIRGLSLTHMFESGIPFIDASTELYLHRGTLEIASMQIDGAASAFSFNGVSDLKAESIDGELLVTLPVANNLPWVAALAAGLPVAAGVFVVSKVFEKQVNRMSSAVYGVTGPIDDPEVEFRRLFDDRISAPPEVPADTGTGGD